MSLFFFFLLYPYGIYRPRGALCQKSPIKDDRVDRGREGESCYKRKWQFRWENGNCDGRSDGISSGCRKVCIREFTLWSAEKKARCRAPKNILQPPQFSFQRRVSTDVILKETRVAWSNIGKLFLAHGHDSSGVSHPCVTQKQHLRLRAFRSRVLHNMRSTSIIKELLKFISIFKNNKPHLY